MNAFLTSMYLIVNDSSQFKKLRFKKPFKTLLRGLSLFVQIFYVIDQFNKGALITSRIALVKSPLCYFAQRHIRLNDFFTNTLHYAGIWGNSNAATASDLHHTHLLHVSAYCNPRALKISEYAWIDVISVFKYRKDLLLFVTAQTLTFDFIPHIFKSPC